MNSNNPIGTEVSQSFIDPSISETERSLIVGALNVLSERNKLENSFISPSDSTDLMPNQEQHLAEDTSVTISRGMRSPIGMLELHFEPFGPKKTYSTKISVVIGNTGLRLNRDLEPQVIVKDRSQGVNDSPFQVIGKRAIRMQEIILTRTARNLATKVQQEQSTDSVNIN